jgi:hypothetical protein
MRGLGERPRDRVHRVDHGQHRDHYHSGVLSSRRCLLASARTRFAASYASACVGAQPRAISTPLLTVQLYPCSSVPEIIILKGGSMAGSCCGWAWSYQERLATVEQELDRNWRSFMLKGANRPSPRVEKNADHTVHDPAWPMFPVRLSRRAMVHPWRCSGSHPRSQSGPSQPCARTSRTWKRRQRCCSTSGRNRQCAIRSALRLGRPAMMLCEEQARLRTLAQCSKPQRGRLEFSASEAGASALVSTGV